ncbi:MAG: SPOR domain-containing protein [Methylomonas sp.]|jgi:DedD protein
MDQELKQRLIGAAVITALAAIFVPMLFDDAVDETGKEISSLTIPSIPEKEQDVEISPLPEKMGDVATAAPTEKSLATAPNQGGEGEGEIDVAPPKPITHLSGNKGGASTAKHAPHAGAGASAAVGDEDQLQPAPEDVTPPPKGPKPAPQTLPPAPAATGAPAKKQVARTFDNQVDENAGKPAPPTGNDTGTRWYLNAGSFSQKANAVALQESLKQQGFASTLKEVGGEKGVVYKVRIGPMLDRAKAQAVKSKLSQINVNSFVSPDE